MSRLFLTMLLMASAAPLAAQTAATSPVPRSAGTPYAARALPDRIMLTPAADPSRGMAVAWRTDARQTAAEAQIAEEIGAHISFVRHPNHYEPDLHTGLQFFHV